MYRYESPRKNGDSEAAEEFDTAALCGNAGRLGSGSIGHYARERD